MHLVHGIRFSENVSKMVNVLQYDHRYYQYYEGLQVQIGLRKNWNLHVSYEERTLLHCQITV